MLKKSLIIVDHDPIFAKKIVRGLEPYNLSIRKVTNLAECKEACANHNFDYAIIEAKLRLGSKIENGMLAIEILKSASSQVRIIIVSSFASIASAITAIKLGAYYYLPKVATSEQIYAKLSESEVKQLSDHSENLMSPNKVRWEYIQMVFEQCEYNVSETARQLRMHRRTLQRILNKRSPVS